MIEDGELQLSNPENVIAKRISLPLIPLYPDYDWRKRVRMRHSPSTDLYLWNKNYFLKCLQKLVCNAMKLCMTHQFIPTIVLLWSYLAITKEKGLYEWHSLFLFVLLF